MHSTHSLKDREINWRREGIEVKCAVEFDALSGVF